MNRKKTYILTLMLLICSVSAFASKQDEQKISKQKTIIVFGNVFDSFIKNLPVRAKVTLMTEDSLILDTTTCHLEKILSRYYFHVPTVEKKYIIKCSCQGYDDNYFSFNLKPRKGQDEYYATTHRMKKIHYLNEVTVKATRIQVAYRGDTIVYDASAFNLPDGSMLDALVRQLPGAKINDRGEIYIHGEKIDYLTLNGNDFFKGKNQVIMENLPYFTIKDLKVYHKERPQSEQNGIERRKDYVMDVRLKKKYVNSSLVNGEAGAGTKDRWKARIFGLMMGDETHIATFANTNNTNENRKPGMDGSWDPASSSKGVKTTKQAGFTLEKNTNGYRTRENLDVLAKWDDDNIREIDHKESFSSEGNILKNTTSTTQNKNIDLSLTQVYAHEGNINFNTEFFLNYSNQKRYAESIDSLFQNKFINLQNYYSNNNHKMFDTRLHVNLIFSLPWRHYVSLDLNGTYNTNKPDNSSTNQSIYYADLSKYKKLEYFNDNANNHYSYSAELGYNIHLPKGWSFGPSLSFTNRQDNKTQNYFAKDSLDDHLGTNSYNYHSTEHRWQAALNVTKNINNSIFSLKIPVDWAKEQMYYHQSLLDTIANRSKVLFNPNLWYSRFGKNKQTIRYSMNVEQPSFDLLMPYKNSINPLSLAINNPNLRNRITHDLQMSTNIRNDSIDLTWWIKADASCILHEWGNHVNYDTTTGSYTYRMDNVSKPNWQANLEMGLEKYLDLKKRISLDIDGTIKYDHNVDFDIAYNNTTANLSLVKTLVTGLNAKLNYRYETFSAGLTGKVSGRFSRSDRTDFTSINAYDYQYGGKLQYTIPIIKFTIATDATMYSRRGYGSSLMNTNDFLLNAQLTHPFAKGRIIAKLQTFDLLHQMKSTKYSVNAQGWTEIRFNNIPSYLMFSLSFNLIKGKQK